MAPISHKASRSRFLKTMSGGTVVFLVLLVSITLAGFNSGNNLLYLIAGVTMGSIFISLIAGRINLSRIAVRRRLPTYAFAGHPFRMGMEVTNRKRIIRSYGIYLEGGAEEGKPSFLFSIEGKAKEVREAQVLLERRGMHKFPPIVLRSKFPSGLFELRRKVTDPKELIVYPRIHDPSKVLGGSSYIQDEFPRHLKGPGSGLYGVREYRHGEDAAGISWKLSAKLDNLIVRETECEEKRRVCIVFDSGLKHNTRAALEGFEHAVSQAASLVWYLCMNGYSVKFVTRDKVIGYGEGPEHMHRILIVLALIQPAAVDEKRVLTGKSAFEGGTGVLVTCGDKTAATHSTAGGFALVISEGSGPEKP